MYPIVYTLQKLHGPVEETTLGCISRYAPPFESCELSTAAIRLSQTEAYSARCNNETHSPTSSCRLPLKTSPLPPLTLPRRALYSAACCGRERELVQWTTTAAFRQREQEAYERAALSTRTRTVSACQRHHSRQNQRHIARVRGILRESEYRLLLFLVP